MTTLPKVVAVTFVILFISVLMWNGVFSVEAEASGKYWQKDIYGMSVQELSDDLCEYFRLDKGQSGVLVNKVFEKTPVFKAGVKVGDVVTHVCGVSVDSIHILRHEMRKCGEMSNPVTLSLVRDGKKIAISIDVSSVLAMEDEADKETEYFIFKTPGEYPLADIFKDAHSYSSEWRGPYNYLGVFLQDLTDGLREYFRLSDSIGVLITDVAPHSPAEKAGLKSGDIVLAVDDEKVGSAADLKILIAGKDDAALITLKIQRDGSVTTLKATLEKREGKNFGRYIVPFQEGVGSWIEDFRSEAEPEIRSNVEELKRDMEELRKEMQRLKEELEKVQS